MTIEQQHPTSGEALPNSLEKHQRFVKILEALARAPAARTAVEAADLVKNTFQEIESRYAPSGETPMSSSNIIGFQRMTVDNEMIYWYPYKRHVLFIGKNGAMEIRERRERNEHVSLQKEMQRGYEVIQQFPITFQKAGADGQGVWNES